MPTRAVVAMPNRRRSTAASFSATATASFIPMPFAACQSKFYDLGKRPATCPKCATQFDPEEALKSRRVRARTTTTPDYEAEEEQPKPAPVEPDGFEDEVEVLLLEVDGEAGPEIAGEPV